MSCDDLNMQYPNKKTNFNHPQYRASAEIAGGNGGRRPVDNPTTSSNQIASGSSFNFITGSGRDLRLSNGSDPEPWRCRRTDGKKWRCSKDAMPDQKYCDRHAHKNKPRSRKPVETQSQNTKLPSNPSRSNHNYHPTLSMPTSCQQSRFTKSGTIPLSSLSQKIQKPMHSASVGSKRDHFCHQDLEENHQDDCSLTLSMQSCGNNDQDFFQMGTGMWNADADGSNPPNQWVNQGSWLGGPLGEALCLGIASTQKEPPNVSSLHGHSTQDLYQD